MGILRLGHVDVTVTDLDLATAYYTEVIGLLEAERDEDSVYLKCWDEPNHHSLRLTYGPRVGFDQMSFKVEHEDDLDDLENKVQKYGYPVQRVSKGESVGQGESIRFETPSGQHDGARPRHRDGRPGRRPRSTRRPSSRASRASRRRAWTTCSSPPRRSATRRSSTWTSSASGSPSSCSTARATRRRCGWRRRTARTTSRSSPARTAACTTSPGGSTTGTTSARSADILAYNGIQIDVGPTRHGITRGNTIYFFDPLGTRNEVFTGGYRPDPDFPTITWTEDNIGRAVFYYEGELNQRFMTVHT